MLSTAAPICLSPGTLRRWIGTFGAWWISSPPALERAVPVLFFDCTHQAHFKVEPGQVFQPTAHPSFGTRPLCSSTSITGVFKPLRTNLAELVGVLPDSNSVLPNRLDGRSGLRNSTLATSSSQPATYLSSIVLTIRYLFGGSTVLTHHFLQ